jgi:hypothetical protein
MRARTCSGIVALVLLSSAVAAYGQSGVDVQVDDVIDNRVGAEMLSSTFEVRVKLKGGPADKATAARIVVKDARDDRGNALQEGDKPGDFTSRDMNNGAIQFSLKSPARAASSVHVKGNVELFVPGRDPSAVVKVDNALGKLDAPLSSKTLKAAKIEITPLSRARYAAMVKEQKLTEKDIEKMREEGKAHGASEKEIEMMIGLAKAFDSMNTVPGETSVILSGNRADFDRIYRIDILGADGKPIETRGRETTTRGDASLMIIEPAEAPPQNATLQLTLLTDKARQTIPFELEVPLP